MVEAMFVRFMKLCVVPVRRVVLCAVAACMVAPLYAQPEPPPAEPRMGVRSGGGGGGGWRNPQGFRPGEQPNGGQGRGAGGAVNRRSSRMNQSVNELIALLTPDELAAVPLLAAPLTGLINQQRERASFAAQRETVFRETSGTAEQRTRQFHAILQRETELANAQKEAIRTMLAQADDITSEAHTRSETLKAEMVKLRRERTNQPQIKDMNLLIRFYDWLDENMAELDPDGPNPLQLMMMQSWDNAGAPRSQNLDTTAVRTLIPQLRELRNQQEQLLRDASELDTRISEIEDILNIQQQRNNNAPPQGGRP